MRATAEQKAAIPPEPLRSTLERLANIIERMTLSSVVVAAAGLQFLRDTYSSPSFWGSPEEPRHAPTGLGHEVAASRAMHEAEGPEGKPDDFDLIGMEARFAIFPSESRCRVASYDTIARLSEFAKIVRSEFGTVVGAVDSAETPEKPPSSDRRRSAPIAGFPGGIHPIKVPLVRDRKEWVTDPWERSAERRAA